MSYQTYLEVKYPSQCAAFKSRREHDPEAARAEAAMFSYFRRSGFRVTIGETPQGGPDFLCEDKDQQLLLEVTHLDSSAVAQKTGWPNAGEPDCSDVWSFAHISDVLRRTASGKAKQVAGAACARLVAIVCEHDAAQVVMGIEGVRRSMLGDPMIAAPVGSPSAAREVTQLKESLFIRFDKEGKVNTCRESISAVLFVHLSDTSSHVVGALHPCPAVSFQPRVLPQIPLARFREWPPSESILEVEWVVGAPSAAASPLMPVEFEDSELRQE